jgi:IS605 OrfB family transposase
MARRCWCRAGRSAPSTGCTWPTPRPGGRRWPAARPSRGRKGRGGGGTTGAASAWWRRGTADGVRQAQHEAAKTVITWAVGRRIGLLAVGDPRGVLNLPAGRRHNQRTRDWRIGHLISVLKDKAEAAGISLTLVDERGTSSTCPACRSRVPKPAGRVLTCPACQFTGHRELTAAANIAARLGGGTTPASIPAGVTHRRAGAHLPGVAPSRRDPRRRAHHRGARGSPGRHRPAPPTPPRLARESLATRRGALIPYGITGRCTRCTGSGRWRQPAEPEKRRNQ